MKKLAFLVLFTFVFAVSFAVAEDSEPFTIRNGVMFGMTRDEIIACEGAEPFIENNDLIYVNQTAAGADARVIYFMENGSLMGVYITFTLLFTDPSQYIDHFNGVNDVLMAKYGVPDVDTDYLWSNDFYKDDEEKYGLAVQSGDLSIVSIWRLANVMIVHIYGKVSDNNDVEHAIAYYMPDDIAETNTDGI